MKIRIDEPRSFRQALWRVVLILAAVALCVTALKAGMDQVRPYLNARNREMLQRQQAVEAAAKQYVDEVKAECDRDPNCGKELRLEDLVDTRFQGQPVPER